MTAKLLPINVEVAVATTVTLQHLGIPYGWGDKVRTSVGLQDFINFCRYRGVDCSGYINWLVQFTSKESVVWPEGSAAIGDHLHSLSLQNVVESCSYSDCEKKDGALRICGFDHGGKQRHVFGVVDGLTLESHGPEVGVSRRPYTYSSLLNNVTWCYKVAAPVTQEDAPAKSSTLEAKISTLTSLPDDSVEMRNTDGTIRGLFHNSAGTTADGKSFILSDIIPSVFYGIQVSQAEGKVILEQVATPSIERKETNGN